VEGPVIIIANHPNTLMDAWIIGHVCKQPIHYMAKSTFFSSPMKKRLLTSLNMIPINRRTDGNVEGISNTDSFEACYKILEEGKTLVIFPEGNSFPERKLRELKSGTARIALEAERRNGGKLNLKIIPVGIYYSQAEKFRSSVMVTVGQSIGVTELVPEFQTNSSLAAKKLTEKFRIHLERVLVTAENADQEAMIETLFQLLRKKEEALNVEKGAEFMQTIKRNIEEIQLIAPYKIAEIQQLIKTVKWQQEKLAIQADFVSRRFRSRLYIMQICLSILFLLFGLPFFLFGFIHNAIPFKLTDFLVPRITKYIEYFAAMNILLALVFYPLTYFCFVEIFTTLFHPVFFVKLIYLFSLPFSGLYAHSFLYYFKRIGQKWHYIFLIFKQKEALKELQENKKSLEKLISFY